MKPAPAPVKKRNPLRAAAREYAALGWRVFPIFEVTQTGGCECGDKECTRAGKHPAIQKWPESATTDNTIIDGWWAASPDRGIGIATGEASGLTVLDVDGDEGVIALGKLQDGESMPPTPTVETRPGRYHYYFKYKKGIKSQAGKIGVKLDSRNEGGYVVAPPTRHSAGGLYKWLQSPSKVPLADWPDFLKGKVGRPEKPKVEHETLNASDPKDGAKLTGALAFVDPDNEERWGQIGLILGRAYHQSDAGFVIYQAWSARSKKYDAKRTKKHYYERSKEPRDGPLLTTGSLFKWAIEGGWVDDDGRDIINIRDGESPSAVRAAVAVLAATSDVYARGGALVRVITVEEARATGLKLPGEEGVQRNDKQVVLLPISYDYLSLRLDELIQFRRGGKPMDCPMPLAKKMLAMAEWEGIHPLRAITSAPFLRSDGSLCDVAGYDAATGVLLYLTQKLTLTIPNWPSLAEMIKAKEVLLAPYSEVMFVDDTHRAAFVALLLTLITRPILDCVPSFIASSPLARTGKTLITDCASEFAFGYTASKSSYPTDENEMRKALHATALAGDAILAFDNLERGGIINSRELNRFITADVTSDRTLGTSNKPRLINSTTVCFTGNNIRGAADFSARALVIALDPKEEHPERRKFKIANLRGFIREHRPKFLEAALTILRGFVVAGAHAPKRAALGGFQNWDRLICGAVMMTGLPDPLKTMLTAQEDDPDMEMSQTLFEQLLLIASPDKCEFRTRDVAKMMVITPALEAAIEDACPTGIKGLGKWLDHHNNMIVGGIRLTKLSIKEGARRWKIQKVG